MRYKECNNTEFKLQLKAFEVRLKQQRKEKRIIDILITYTTEFLNFQHANGVDTLKKINQKSIDNFINYLLKTRINQRTGLPIAGSYINKFREAVLRFMEFYFEVQIGNCPFEFRYIKMQITTKDILSKEEIRTLFDFCDNTWEGLTDKCLLALLYGCGMRKGEVANLEVNDIDFSKNIIRLDRTKTKQDRDVVMSPTVQQIIEEYCYTARNSMLPTNSDETFLIVTQKGTRISPNTIPWRINQIAERANLGRKINCHLLRHTIATHLLESLSLEEVAHFLGHKNLDSTQIYTHYFHQNTRQN